IGAFITMYGGVNSHMAIRAGELGIPAVIGVGQSLYKRLAKAKHLHVDCGNKQIMDLSLL
ncbi:PEP-utilizing enzyme, partial [Acinetobacter baumannii]